MLHLHSWKDGGCPIIKFDVKYKRKFENDYILLSNNIVYNEQSLVISDLFAGSWYSLLLTSFNEAGFTQSEYSFSTLTMNGEQIAVFENENFQDFAHQLKVIMPTVCSLFVLIIVLGVAYKFHKKRRNLISNNNHSQAGKSA